MTLKVTKIIDEMVDLETGQTFSHGIVVTNGRREEFIPLSQDALRPLVMLYAETIPVSQEERERQVQERAQELREVGQQRPAPAPPAPAQAEVPRPAQTRLDQPTKPQLIDPNNDIEFTPLATTDEEEEEEPAGEEYDDELTGVASF